ncbi:MAG: hypothetical protein H6571_16585 [Lewinellaceae bacterium]|nr:hypothetical protein [Bacteroidota bacterium]MCB9325358.1 hypothetical protein [Lewinellaceae bacterium]
MKKEEFIEAIPLIILTIIGIYSIIEVITSEYIFGIQQHVGLTLLGISIILFFANKRIYKYIFGITLLLGLVNLIGFTTSILTMNFFGLPIQILMIPLIAVYTWVNKEEIKPKIQNLLGNSNEQIKLESNSKINGFKRRFEKLSDNEIESKLNQNLVSEAIEALKQIKKERENVL